MTPEEAQKLLEGTAPAPWEVELRSYEEPAYPGELVEFWLTSHNGECIAHDYDIPGQYSQEIDSNYTLMAAAPELAATIAGMTPEYALVARAHEGGEWHRTTEWRGDGYLQLPGHTLRDNERIIVRYVTEPNYWRKTND